MKTFKAGMWAGAVVAIVGNAAGITAAQVQEVGADRIIAVNRAIVHAPAADMLVSIDANWPSEANAFEGIRVVGIPDIDGAQYLVMPHETVTFSPFDRIEIRNNMLSAIRLAEEAGASRIVLLGVDTQRYEQIHQFRGFTEGLAQLTVELMERGIPVEIAKLHAGGEAPKKPLNASKTG
jgi:hypothetical protein